MYLHTMLPKLSVGLSSFFVCDVNLAPSKSGARGNCPPFPPRYATEFRHAQTCTNSGKHIAAFYHLSMIDGDQKEQ